MMIGLTSCGNKEIDDSLAAQLTDYTIVSENDGTEDSQRVVLTLYYDQDVTVDENKAEDLRITIGDVRIDEDDITFEDNSEDSTSVIIEISTTAVYEGDLVADSEDSQFYGIVTTEDGYPAEAVDIECQVPSGVELETVSSTTGDDSTLASVTKQVTNGFNIRSIAWIQLIVDGEVVAIDDGASVSEEDDAVGIHGHNFLMYIDTSNAASLIEESLEEAFSENYDISVEDDLITVTSKEIGAEEIDLQVYLY